MTETTEDIETVEVPLPLVRDAVDVFADTAKRCYKSNNTTWGDRYHSRASELNDIADDDWHDVGYERFLDRMEDDD